MKIERNILDILEQCETRDGIVYLPNIQLDRKTYLAVNKHLENLGGKWNRKAKGHVFDEDPTEAFDNMLSTGETTDFKKELQFFETPPELAERMAEMAELEDELFVMEPSAGRGAIAIKILEAESCELLCIEINPKMATYLQQELGLETRNDDFLTVNNLSSDRIIMNPPFSKQQDIDHVLHAYSLLNPGGILVSIMSEGPFFRENKKSVEFREFLKSINAEVEKLPEGTFKSSGTMVNTRLIKITKISV